MTPQKIVPFDSYFCDACRKFVYDELSGEPELGILPKTQVSDLPANWTCPVCQAGAESLRAVTLTDDHLETALIESQSKEASGSKTRLRNHPLDRC